MTRYIHGINGGRNTRPTMFIFFTLAIIHFGAIAVASDDDDFRRALEHFSNQLAEVKDRLENLEEKIDKQYEAISRDIEATHAKMDQQMLNVDSKQRTFSTYVVEHVEAYVIDTNDKFNVISQNLSTMQAAVENLSTNLLETDAKVNDQEIETKLQITQLHNQFKIFGETNADSQPMHRRQLKTLSDKVNRLSDDIQGHEEDVTLQLSELSSKLRPTLQQIQTLQRKVDTETNSLTTQITIANLRIDEIESKQQVNNIIQTTPSPPLPSRPKGVIYFEEKFSNLPERWKHLVGLNKDFRWTGEALQLFGGIDSPTWTLLRSFSFQEAIVIEFNIRILPPINSLVTASSGIRLYGCPFVANERLYPTPLLNFSYTNYYNISSKIAINVLPSINPGSQFTGFLFTSADSETHLLKMKLESNGSITGLFDGETIITTQIQNFRSFPSICALDLYNSSPDRHIEIDNILVTSEALTVGQQ